MPRADAAYRTTRARFRRQIEKGEELAAAQDFTGALGAFRAAQAEAGILALSAGRRQGLMDLARAARRVGDTARRTGDTAAAITAFRACHDHLMALVALRPGDVEHQTELVRINASLRDALREADDKRLALAAARLAAANARTLAEQFPGDAPLTFEALQHRVTLARMLRGQERLDEAATAFREAIRLGDEAAARRIIDGAEWDMIRRAHLDLADMEQGRHAHEAALDVLTNLRAHVVRRLSLAPRQTARLADAAQERFLTGLVFAMIDDQPRAAEAFGDAVEILERVDGPDLLGAAVQQQRGRILAHADRTATLLFDEEGRAALREKALARLKALADEAPFDARRQHGVMAHAYDLARTLIDKQAPELACHVLTYAREILERQDLGDDDRRYHARWSAFLELELGRACRANGDHTGALEAFEASLAINAGLWSEEPADIRAQCDSAYADWQLALIGGDGRQGRLRRARAILKLLDRGGRLPPYASPWLARIERDLAGAA